MRPLEVSELSQILETIRFRGNEPLAKELEDGTRVLFLDDALRLHLSSRELAKFLTSGKHEPTAVGEPWGRFEDGRWTPSLAGLVRTGARKRDRRIVISETAAQHFLYHKGVHKEGVLERDPNMRPGQEAWVIDPHGNVLGRGRLLEQSPKKPNVVEPIDDLGWYLREGG